MAKFNTHLSVGSVASVSSAVLCWKSQIFNDVFNLIIAGLLGIVGSILPDIDAKQLTPTKM